MDFLKSRGRYLFKPFFNIVVSVCCCHGNSIRIIPFVIRRRSPVQEYVYIYTYYCSGSYDCRPPLNFVVPKAECTLVNIVSGNGLVPVRRQSIALTNIELLSIWPPWKFRENLNQSTKNMRRSMVTAIIVRFCGGGGVGWRYYSFIR